MLSIVVIDGGEAEKIETGGDGSFSSVFTVPVTLLPVAWTSVTVTGTWPGISLTAMLRSV